VHIRGENSSKYLQVFCFDDNSLKQKILDKVGIKYDIYGE
jgi:hypothetical protein